jgi:hypothetical protein
MVVLCIRKCLQFGLPDDAIAWVRNCACQKPKESGYSYELWTNKLLGVALGHVSRSKLHKTLRHGELRPPKQVWQDSILWLV